MIVIGSIRHVTRFQKPKELAIPNGITRTQRDNKLNFIF